MQMTPTEFKKSIKKYLYHDYRRRYGNWVFFNAV